LRTGAKRAAHWHQFADKICRVPLKVSVFDLLPVNGRIAVRANLEDGLAVG